MTIKHISGQSNDKPLNAAHLRSVKKLSIEQFLNSHSRGTPGKWNNAGHALKSLGAVESQQILKKTVFEKKVLNQAVIKEQELIDELEILANNRRLNVAKPVVIAKNSDEKALDTITQQFQNRFAKSASNKDEFHRILKDAFGDKYDANKAEAIRQKTLNGDFSWMPKITLVDGSELNDVSQAREGVGLGAYSKDKDTVYLSRDLLRSDPAKAEAILSEEIGHALDIRLNTSDAAGDEGDIFSRLLHGENISQKALTELRAENDSGVININGEDIEVEYGWFKKLRKKIKKAVKKIGRSIKKAVKKVGSVIKKGFKKIMTSKLVGAIMTVAQFIPIPIPIVQVAAKAYNIIKGMYGVAQGIKNKSFGAVLSGVASIAGGAGKLGRALGASQKFIDGANKVASTLRTTSAAYGAIKNKDYLGLVSAVGQYAPTSAFTTTLKPYLQIAQQGTAAYKAAKSGDILGAIGIGASFAQNFTGDNADKLLGNIAGHAETASLVKTAIETGNYAQAATLLKDNYAGKLGLSPEQQAKLENTTDSLIKLETARGAIKDKNYTQAASIFAGLAAQTTDDPAKKASLERAVQAVQNIDNTVQAYKSGDYASAANFAAVAMGQPLDDKTQDFLSQVQDTAHKIDVAQKTLKSGDADQIANALASLGQAAGINKQATDLLINVGDKVGKAQDLKTAIDSGDFESAGRILAESGVFGQQETPAQKVQTALQTAVSDFQKTMTEKAQNSTQFHQLMRASFNAGYSYREAEVIRQQSAKGDFSWMPDIEVRRDTAMQDQSAPSLGGLQGAYSEAANTIYLSESLLNGEPLNITRVLTEEVGHAIDAKISRTDSTGDEGDIFARLMSGETLSQEQLAGLRAENDHALLNIDGESLAVEAAGMSNAAIAGLNFKISQLPTEDRTFFEGIKNGIVDTGMDIINAARLAYKLTTDPSEREKFSNAIGKISEALSNEETRGEAIKLIGSELGAGLLEAFTNFGDDPDYYTGYLVGSVAAGGAISKLAKFAAVATKLDKIIDTLKRIDIRTEGFGSNGGNIRIGLKPQFDKVTADNLDEVLRIYGHNAGPHTRTFKSWLNKGGKIDILPDNSIKYSIPIDGKLVAVIYKN